MDKVRALRTSLARVRTDWGWGRRCGYPWCCIAMYCWDRLWSLPPSLTRTVAQGLDPPDSDFEWVPCGVLHPGDSSLPFTERVRRLAAYWWWSFPFMHRSSVSAQGWLRAPWLAPPCDCPGPAPGPMEEAWAELDESAQDRELDWL